MSGLVRFARRKGSHPSASASEPAATTAAASNVLAASAVEGKNERASFTSFGGGGNNRPSSAGGLSTASEDMNGMFTGFGGTRNGAEESAATFSVGGFGPFDIEPNTDMINNAPMTGIPRSESDRDGSIFNVKTTVTESDAKDASPSKGPSTNNNDDVDSTAMVGIGRTTSTDSGDGKNSTTKEEKGKRPQKRTESVITRFSRAKRLNKQSEATDSTTTKQPDVQPRQVGPSPTLLDSDAAVANTHGLGVKELPPTESNGTRAETPEIMTNAAAQDGDVPIEHGGEKGVIPSSKTNDKIVRASSTSLHRNQNNKNDVAKQVEVSHPGAPAGSEIPPPPMTTPVSRTFLQPASIDANNTFREGTILDRLPHDATPKISARGLAPKEVTTVTPEPQSLLADSHQQSPAERYTETALANNDLGVQGNDDAPIPSDPNGTLTSPMRYPKTRFVNGSGDAERNLEEVTFDGLLAAFVGDLRDTMDLVEAGDVDLLDLEVLHAQAYSNAQQVHADQMDLMEDIEALTSSVRATNREYRA